MEERKNNRVIESLQDKIMGAKEAAKFIKSDMILGFSGFTLTGDPKTVPQYIDADNLTLITSASVGDLAEGILCRKGSIARRYPYQSNLNMRKEVNLGEVAYADFHLSNMPAFIERENKPCIDYAIIECTKITENGIVPTTSVGITPTLVKYSKNIILEVNTLVPEEMEQMMDIFNVGVAPHAKIIPIESPMDRIGKTYIPFDKRKVKAIVMTHEKGTYPKFIQVDDDSKKIAQHIVEFLKEEIEAGRQPVNLLPIQSGVGAIANAVLSGLKKMNLKGLHMYTETMQDSAFELLESGCISGISTCALCLSEEKQKKLFQNIDTYKDKIILRPQNVTNSPEVVRRLGIIAMNTPVEFDIYGNVNSTHALGTKIINGIGGSGDFTRNAGLSIFATKSEAKEGNISRVVPMVSHCDHSEHDTQIFVTEWGLADLRWKSPKERVNLIIEKCAHPDYREALRDYYKKAVEVSGSTQTPQDLEHAFALYLNYQKEGSMLHNM